MIALQDWLVEIWWQWVVPLSWQLAVFVALIAMVAWCARRAVPQVRYVLWCLVLVKIFLPPSLAVKWGVGTWALRPAWQGFQAVATEESIVVSVPEPAPSALPDTSQEISSSTPNSFDSRHRNLLFTVWLVGCVSLLATSFWQYRRLLRSTRGMETLDEGPLQFEYESLALKISPGKSPELFISDEVVSPFLFGLWRPKIVMPQAMVDQFSQGELRNVLSHELNHWRRRDLWVGWVQVAAQSLLWFHPLVWWANARIRHERECACDEGVLRLSGGEPAAYGETLLRVLSAARGRALHQGSLVGVFEPGANIQQRLEQIMNYKFGDTRFSVVWYPALLVLMLILLPMMPVSLAKEKQPAAEKKPAAKMPAWIVETSPTIGAVDVDPTLREVSVTFDRDMSGGMSWTGDESLFPPKDPEQPPYWRDKRTCVFPVIMAKGAYYRLGINSKSFRNFRNAQGQPAPCTEIYFVTEGATKAIQSRVRKPEIVKMIPTNGATDVDPGTKVLRVTFNMPMGGGMSWVGSGENFPGIVAGEQAKWSGDGKTCTLPVVLQPDYEYELGINSLQHINFQSKWGVHVEPVKYAFRTRAAK